MKRISISILSLLLVAIMLLGAFASCTDNTQDNSETTESGSVSGSETDKKGNDTESDTEDTGEDKDPDTDVELDAYEALQIKNANKLANGVQAYFSDATRREMTFENLNMSLEYALSSNQAQQVTALKNKNGKSYIEDTMDVFITMENGKTYYGSKSNIPTAANIYRFGYYFYEMRFEEQLFASNFNITESKSIAHHKVFRTNHIESFEVVDKSLSVTNTMDGTDPYIIFGNQYLGVDVPAERFQFLKVTLTADEATATNAMLFIVAGEDDGSGLRFTANQSTSFTISNDGQKHEYLIPLTSIPGYTHRLRGLRLDISGVGAKYQIHGLELVAADLDGAPTDLGIARIFNTYSDKLHQVLQVAAKKTTSGIKEIGFTTDIKADTVSSLIIMNKDGSTLSDPASVSNWADVVAVGFDIKDAGVFGYILPYDGNSGSLKVTLKDGVYNVLQTCTPKDETIIPSRGDYNIEKDYYNSVVPYNRNDFYMGNRIYTDDTHSFDGFLYEAYCETNPLNEKYVSVSSSSTDGYFLGYDALRGIYKFSIAGAPNFNVPYFDSPNKHYNVTFSVRGDKYDRKVYMMTATTNGSLECAVLLDKDQLVLPIPMEVGKNFSEAGGERNLFNVNDETYGETIFPIVIEAGVKNTYSVINIYQNWGQFPLKQISWIQFFAPYYHLSTGVTETNCILPWYSTKNSKGLNTLPDFRTMSAPFWGAQPQHNSCGVHMWLNYNDADGTHYITSENILDVIDSYGPTYADVKMDYVSDDGKIKLSYTHTEMPQTDENRTFYEMTYEVLEDVSINDFRNNFQLYSTFPNNPSGNYKKIGYLDKNNEYQVVDSILHTETNEDGKIISTFGDPQYFVLGDECPYFSFFDMDGADPNHQEGYANLAFLVYNYELIIGGEKSNAHFMIKNIGRKIILTLDLDNVTLKKGDTFTINAILLPWGSQELDRDYADASKPDPNAVYYDTVIDEATNELYMDKNVRDVRENTLLNPVKAVAGENTELIESVFVPKVKSTNGKNAEFTISGGHNNVAVRVYGFDKLTAPKIEEYKNGEWVEYAVNSSATPDSKGNLHYYDGYMAHYDGDGTFSYSFVVAMDNGAERRFRIAADQDFIGWPAEPVADEKREDLLDVFVDHQEIYSILKDSTWVSDAVVSEDDSYVSLFGTGEGAIHANNVPVTEGYLFGYNNSAAITESGHLFTIKYRIPTTNKRAIDRFEIFTSTENAKASENNKITTTALEADGEWHVIVIDLSKVTKTGFTTSEFKADSDGKYKAKFIRFDFFDKWMNTTDYIDIAFFSLDNSMDDICRLLREETANNVETLTLIAGPKTFAYDVFTGDAIDSSAPTLESFIHPDCTEFTASDLDYASCVDGINGKNIPGGSNSKILNVEKQNINDNPFTLPLNSTTISGPENNNSTMYKGTYLVISGWTVIDGGVDRYVWSADGGKTWNECFGYKCGITSVSDEHLKNASRRISKEGTLSTFTTADDKAGGMYQGLDTLNPKGIAADLKDYVGKTAHIIFAAVPAKATDTLCFIAYVTDVKVVANEEIVVEPTYNDYVKEESGYSVSNLAFAACIDRVVTTKSGQHVNSNSTEVPVVQFNRSPIASADTENYINTPGTYLVFSGWALVRSGIEKYMWSADGGKTWHEAELYKTSKIENVSDGVMGSNRIQGLGYTFNKQADGINCMFQAPSDASVVKGLAANLEAYSGQTVDVIFGAAPRADAKTLCIFTVVTGVQVP